jgi:predicted metal-dependent enzyme (double-stranded beta helix superfamily)
MSAVPSLAVSQRPARHDSDGLLEPGLRTALLRRLHTDHTTSSRDYLAAARRLLEELVADRRIVAGLELQRREGGYARNLLAGDERVGIWAMVWAPGAVTCIHDHHCSCCFGVVGGTVDEIWYRAVSETHAVAEAEHARGPGYVACMLPSGPNLHRMENRSAGDAISIHIYGYDHNRQGSSVHREYLALEN